MSHNLVQSEKSNIRIALHIRESLRFFWPILFVSRTILNSFEIADSDLITNVFALFKFRIK